MTIAQAGRRMAMADVVREKGTECFARGDYPDAISEYVH